MDGCVDACFPSEPGNGPAQPRQFQPPSAQEILEHRRLRVVGQAGERLSGLHRQTAVENDALPGGHGHRFGKGTIDVYWQRVKEASGYVTAGNRVKGSETTDQKTLADLKTIINRIFKAEEEGESCTASDFKGTLMEVYESLGGDVDNLG